VGRYPNVCCVPISNTDGSDNLFGLNREHDIAQNPLKSTDQPGTDDWQLGQVKGRGDARRLHYARRSNDERQRRDELQRAEQEHRLRWGLGQGRVVERVDAVLSDYRFGRSGDYLSRSYPPYVLDAEDETATDIILSTLMPPPPIEYEEDVRLEWEVEGVVPSQPSTEHVEPRITWKAPPSRFDYKSFTSVHTSSSYPSQEDAPWLYVSLSSDHENSYASDDKETITQPSTNPPGPELTTPDQPTPSYAIDHADDIFEMSPDIEIDIASDEPILELTMRF